MPLQVIDATCPLVKRLHAAAADLEQKGYSMIIAGKRKHRETEGVAGRLKKAPVILETPEEAEQFLPVEGVRYAVVSQTTLSVDEYESMIRALRKKIPDLTVSGGICRATTSRQAAVKKLTSVCPRIIVIGSVNSSNSKRLQEVAESAGAEAILIPDVSALPDSFFEYSGNIGITGGASAPEYLVDELISRLQEKGWELA
jgi:4-hydroxy-3-methylbut-2-enyl diphosphate reductase